MKPLLILSFVLVVSSAVAQTNKLDSLANLTHKYDSTLQKPGQKLNATQLAVNQKADSLKQKYTAPLTKIDSIESAFYSQSDSLKQRYKSKLSHLDSANTSLSSKIDSLKNLKLSTEKYTHKLDSVNQQQTKVVGELNQKIEKLKANTTGKLNELQLDPELKGPLSNATKNIDNFKLPAKDLNITSLNLPSGTMKNLDGLSADFTSPLAKVGNVNELGRVGDLAKVDNLAKIDGLPKMPGELGQVSDITKQAGAYSGDLKNISQGNLNEVKALPSAVENKAGELSGLNDVTSQTKQLDQYKDQLGQMKDPAAMKDQALEKGTQMAIDHFAGKEEVLQKAMEQVSKYKEKYSSLQSLEDAKKRRPNEMRNKPIRERLLPGIGFQVHHKNDLLVDFNPYLGYRFTGRFTSGMGWNQRWAYNEKHDSFHARARVFGPRAYAEFNLFKGFFPRFEIEALNTFVPTSFNPSTSDVGQREWVCSAFLGLKKTYKFLKKINGTTSVMLNIYNPHHKSPYGDIVNVRFGFEFPIKKKQKAKHQKS